jgi:predicted outer membrane repeat protein
MYTKTPLLSLLLLFAAYTANATIYYITPNGGGTMAGTSWTNARGGSALQTTINAAIAGDEIWVAAGTYKPTHTISGSATPADIREKCFVMKGGVKILGGFPNSGAPTLAQRKPFVNKTILSGELQNDNSATNNAYNIIRNFRNGLTSTAVLDGFWIMNGAGGLYNGSAMLIDQCSPSIFNCVFSDNSSKDGGAISIANNASPKFITCIIMNNTATGRGGAMIVNASLPTFANSLLFNNKATTGGGGVFASGSATLTFYVCDIHGNFSATNGGFAYTTVNGNRFNFYNSIVWSNTGTQLIYDDGMASIRNIQNSIYPEVTPATFFNKNENPLYTAEWDPDGNDNIFGTDDDGMTLAPDSPAVGLGNASLIPAYITTDITGSPRISGTKIDAGAYEYQFRTVATEDQTAAEETIAIFPNPAQDFVNIRSEIGLNNAKFILFSATGMQVLQTNVSASANDAQTVLLNDLPQGVYFYQIIADEKRFNGRIMIK